MINSPVLKKIMFQNIKYFYKENGRKLTPFWDTELYVMKDKNLHFRRFLNRVIRPDPYWLQNTHTSFLMRRGH